MAEVALRHILSLPGLEARLSSKCGEGYDRREGPGGWSGGSGGGRPEAGLRGSLTRRCPFPGAPHATADVKSVGSSIVRQSDRPAPRGCGPNNQIAASVVGPTRRADQIAGRRSERIGSVRRAVTEDAQQDRSACGGRHRRSRPADGPAWEKHEGRGEPDARGGPHFSGVQVAAYSGAKRHSAPLPASGCIRFQWGRRVSFV